MVFFLAYETLVFMDTILASRGWVVNKFVKTKGIDLLLLRTEFNTTLNLLYGSWKNRENILFKGINPEEPLVLVISKCLVKIWIM